MLVRAHGIAGPGDLPVPFGVALVGAAVALTVSFAVLGLAWRRPRYDPPRPGRHPAALARVVDSPAYAWVVRLLGLLASGWTAVALVAGPDLDSNPAFGVVYVLLWVGLVPASLLLGPVVHALSPVRTLLLLLTRLPGFPAARDGAGLRAETDGPLALPSWVGVWPGAVLLTAFGWQELVDPASGLLWSLRLWVGAWLAVTVVGGLLFGTRWLAAADPFEVYSTLVARLSPWGRDGSGRLVVRSPLANLADTPARNGTAAAVAALLGTTAYDSLSQSPSWLQTVQSAGAPVVLGTVVILAAVLLVGGLFAGAAVATPAAVVPRRRLPDRLAHAVVPIVVGYVAAHYLTFLVVTGTQTLARLSDPLVTGADLLGTADLTPPLWLVYHPTALATVQVVAVVAGHVTGVVASHDRALGLLPRRDRLTGQLPMLGVMLVFTVGGLFLLFAA